MTALRLLSVFLLASLATAQSQYASVKFISKDVGDTLQITFDPGQQNVLPAWVEISIQIKDDDGNFVYEHQESLFVGGPFSWEGPTIPDAWNQYRIKGEIDIYSPDASEVVDGAMSVARIKTPPLQPSTGGPASVPRLVGCLP